MKNTDHELIETDVLVIGGGCAGCWAAIRADKMGARVVLADKAMISRSGSAIYCHNFMAPLEEGMLDAWLKEIIKYSDYLGEPRFVEILLTEQGYRVRELIEWGMPFEKDEKGDLLLTQGRGHSISKVVLFDGRPLMEVLRREILARKIKLVERVMLTELLTSDGQHPTTGRVIGAVGLHTRTGQSIVIKAKAVVVTTGMTSGKLHFSYADNLTGDGQTMAYRAGAQMGGLEFTFCPKFAAHKSGKPVCSLIQFQTLGAHIVNSKGERFMERYVPERMERRSGIGLLIQGITKEVMEGRGPVYWDMTHFSRQRMEQVRRIIPTTIAALNGAGIDPAKQKVECRAVVIHFGSFASGGVRIDTQGASSIPGLFSAGVAAQFSGAVELLSGVMLSFANVFGYRAGEAAARFAREQPESKIDKDQLQEVKSVIMSPLSRKGKFTPRDIYHGLLTHMIKPEIGVVKTEESIGRMLAQIELAAQEKLPQVSAQDIHTLVQANEARNFVHFLEPIFVAARERKESRLTHYRLDYPYKDDIDWLKWVVVKKGPKGATVSHEPLVQDRQWPELAKPGRAPALIQISKLS